MEFDEVQLSKCAVGPDLLFSEPGSNGEQTMTMTTIFVSFFPQSPQSYIGTFRCGFCFGGALRARPQRSSNISSTVRISASATVDDFEEGSMLDEIFNSHQGQNPHCARDIARSLGMSPKGSTETETHYGKF